MTSVKLLYFCRSVLAFALGAGPVSGLLLGERFPNRIRANAMAICGVHWVSASQFDHIYWVRLSASFGKHPYSGAAAWEDLRPHYFMISMESENFEGLILIFTLLINLTLQVLQPFCAQRGSLGEEILFSPK